MVKKRNYNYFPTCKPPVFLKKYIFKHIYSHNNAILYKICHFNHVM